MAVLSKPDDDVVPFVTTAQGGSFQLIGWESLDEELQDKFLTHVLPSAVGAQDVEMVGLVITTYLTPMTEGRELREDERYEALLIAMHRDDLCGELVKPARRSGRGAHTPGPD